MRLKNETPSWPSPNWKKFEIGEWVYLWLQTYRHNSLVMRRNLKLSPRFYGPYKILQKMGQAAYKLELPTNSKIHPVSCIKLEEEAWPKLHSSDVTPKSLWGRSYTSNSRRNPRSSVGWAERQSLSGNASPMAGCEWRRCYLGELQMVTSSVPNH